MLVNIEDLIIEANKMLNESLEKEKTAENGKLVNWKDRQEGYTNAAIDYVNLILSHRKKAEDDRK